jgi:hypothetical protein
MKTLFATSSQANPKTLATREVPAHPHVVFYPSTCGLRGDAIVVAAVLIDYGGARSLLGRGCGFGERDQLLPLHQCTTTLDRCSNTSSAALCI